MPWVYDFADGSRDMRDLLGGKGANLAEMASIDLPVPPGFTISTEMCTRYYEEGERFPEKPVTTLVDIDLARKGTTYDDVEKAFKRYQDTYNLGRYRQNILKQYGYKGQVLVRLMADYLAQYTASVKADQVVPTLEHEFFRRVEQPVYRMPGFPYTSILGAMLMAAILISTAFTSEFRWTLAFGLPSLGLFALAYATRPKR